MLSGKEFVQLRVLVSVDLDGQLHNVFGLPSVFAGMICCHAGLLSFGLVSLADGFMIAWVVPYVKHQFQLFFKNIFPAIFPAFYFLEDGILFVARPLVKMPEWRAFLVLLCYLTS